MKSQENELILAARALVDHWKSSAPRVRYDIPDKYCEPDFAAIYSYAVPEKLLQALADAVPKLTREERLERALGSDWTIKVKSSGPDGPIYHLVNREATLDNMDRPLSITSTRPTSIRVVDTGKHTPEMLAFHAKAVLGLV